MLPMIPTLLLVISLASSDGLMINGAGLQPWNLDDTALVVYVTITNNGNKPAEDITVDMRLCCLDEADMGLANQCLTFRSLDDHLGFLNAGKEHNFTVILPTVYPYDRNGECLIHVKYDDGYEQQQQFQFDTRLFGENRKFLPKYVKNQTAGLVQCDNPDHDPVRGCKPYECTLKYGSNKGYYNKKTEKCEKAPICASTDSKIVVFSPKYSACRAEDLKLDNQIPGREPFTTNVWNRFSLRKKYKDVCVHGIETGNGCECDDGWTTSTNGHSAFDPVQKVYKLCNTKTADYTETLRPVGLLEAIAAVGFVVLILSLLLMTILQYQKHIVTKHLSQISLNILREQVALKEEQEGLEYMQLSDYIARVTIPNDPPGPDSEMLTLSLGDIITDLESTDDVGIWKGTLGGRHGMFSVTSVDFYMPSEAPEV